jgi:hypothetical protein
MYTFVILIENENRTTVSSQGRPYETASKLDIQTTSQFRTASEETNKMHITYTSLCLLNWSGVASILTF